VFSWKDKSNIQKLGQEPYTYIQKLEEETYTSKDVCTVWNEGKEKRVMSITPLVQQRKEPYQGLT